MSNPQLPPLRKSDTPVIDRYYYVDSPWFVPEMFVKAKYVGEWCNGDCGSQPWFRVDGHPCLFQVGNPYMVRSDLATLRKTFLAWAQRDLLDRTDEARLEASRNGILERIRRINEDPCPDKVPA